MPDQPNDFHARIRVLEEWRNETRDLLHGIAGKIDALATLVTRRGENMCSAPGSCIEIRKEVQELRSEHKDTMARVMRLERWQVFLTGIAAAIAVGWAVLRFILPFIINQEVVQ